MRGLLWKGFASDRKLKASALTVWEEEEKILLNGPSALRKSCLLMGFLPANLLTGTTASLGRISRGASRASSQRSLQNPLRANSIRLLHPRELGHCTSHRGTMLGGGDADILSPPDFEIARSWDSHYFPQCQLFLLLWV